MRHPSCPHIHFFHFHFLMGKDKISKVGLHLLCLAHEQPAWASHGGTLFPSQYLLNKRQEDLCELEGLIYTARPDSKRECWRTIPQDDTGAQEFGRTAYPCSYSSCPLSISALDQCSSLELSATTATDHKHLKCNYTTKEVHFNLISII